MDWPHVFPGSLVPPALGLYVVTVQCSSLFNDGPGDLPGT